MSYLESATKIRAEFPALTQKIRGKSLIYLDSAASALKPWPVIERISHFYTYETSNVHRGAHYVADLATGFFEEARKKVQKFLGAANLEEIVFTRGTTESINLVAQTYGRKFLKEGDEILLTELEHHANIVPWQILASEKGLKVQFAKILDNGELDLNDFKSKLSSKTKLVAVSHCSNTLGTILDVKALAKLAHAVGAKILIDGAQAVANRKVDVVDLDVDFYAFSGHKLFGPYGIGVLYGKKDILEEMPPYQGGGSMISEVKVTGTTFNDIPHRFEAGTPHIEGVIALGTAIDYVEKIGYDKIHGIETELLEYATSQIKNIPGLRLIGEAKDKAAILSFVIDGLHHSDIGQILDQEGVAVRAGHHCTQPLMARLGITGTVRASFSIFNTKADVDALIKGILKAKEMLS